MKTKLKNVTVSLEADVARWARQEAARRQTSVSRLLEELLKERMHEEEDGYDAAMRRSLARRRFLKTDGRNPHRRELPDRSSLE
jgi:hypothetical protein